MSLFLWSCDRGSCDVRHTDALTFGFGGIQSLLRRLESAARQEVNWELMDVLEKTTENLLEHLNNRQYMTACCDWTPEMFQTLSFNRL